MRWYLITIPFITIFLFSGFKLDVYYEQNDNIDLIVENSLYETVNINQLRTMDEGLIKKEEFENNLIKYLTMQPNYSLDYDISYKVVSTNPIIVDVLLETKVYDSNIGISRTFILDSTI